LCSKQQISEVSDHYNSADRNPSSVIPESTSSSLIDRVKLREPEAWQRLVKLYGPLIYRWCRASSLQPDDSADVVQEVFRSVMTGLNSFRKDRPGDSFRGWLWTVTRNKIRDHHRRGANHPHAAGGTDAQQQFQQLPDDPPEETGTQTSIPDSGLIQRALQIIKLEFEESTFQAFWRMTIDGLSATEVADELGMTKGAVRQAKYR
jgi:RNA polymerase sigma-70 factor (ECF subfamily)